MVGRNRAHSGMMLSLPRSDIDQETFNRLKLSKKLTLILQESFDLRCGPSARGPLLQLEFGLEEETS